MKGPMGKNMGGGMPNMNGMMKQMQKMQAEMAKAQEELAEAQVDFSSGGGAVKVVVSGQKELISVKIDPSAIDPDDAEMLEDLILAAVNGAMKKADAMAANRMQSVTGGVSIPGMPF